MNPVSVIAKPVATRLSQDSDVSLALKEVVALRLPWLVNNRNVPDAWIFSFQSALSCVALRKPNLHIPRGEIVLSLFNGHFFELSQPSAKNFFAFFLIAWMCLLTIWNVTP